MGKGTMASYEQRIKVHTLSKKTEDRETCAAAHSTRFSDIGESVQSSERLKQNPQFESHSFIICQNVQSLHLKKLKSNTSMINQVEEYNGKYRKRRSQLIYGYEKAFTHIPCICYTSMRNI